MKKWKSYFTSHILQRGKDYYDDGAVYNLHQAKECCTAKVEGSWDYTVKIKLSNNKIHSMHCTCPYAYDGNNCKHMAAVLYAIENEKIQSPSSNQMKESKRNQQKMEQELTSVIYNISEAELRKLLLELAQNDISLANRIITEYSDNCGEQGLLSLKKEVDKMCEEHSDRYGFISYSEAADFTEELDNFLYEKVDPLVDKGLLMEAFEITNYVFYRIGTQEMDDSEGGGCWVANSCFEIWEDILEQVNQEEERRIFRWFMEHRKGYVNDYMEDYIEDILMQKFQNEEMIREKMILLDAEIENMAQKTTAKSFYSVRHELEDNILKRIEFMEQLQCSSEEIENYRSQYRRFPAIRQLEIQEYIDSKQYKKAIKVLKESKKADAAHSDLTDEYSRQLIEIYEEMGDDNNCKKELLYQILYVYQTDLKYIKKLKEIADEQEWSEWKKKILTSYNTKNIKYSFMQLEGMYEELLDDIVKNGFIDSLDKYSAVLRTKFPEKVCNAYITYAKSQARKVSNRNEYHELVQYLKKIATYPNGKTKAQELADEWKREYQKRRAMMDEIKKAGF